jgi:ribosome-binding protein aMBF1 (putative translation factor)
MDKFEPIDWKDVKKELLKDPEFKKEYDALGLEFSIIEQVIRKRLENGLTQKELAEKIGTKQSAIARLESGNSNPSVAFLNKISRALGGKLQVTI